MSESSKSTTFLLALIPLLLLAALITWLVKSDIDGTLRGDAPPIELLAFQSTTLKPEMIEFSVVNDGPDPITIAQVMVDEAYWAFHQSPPGPLAHLDRATLSVPYPWVEGEAHELVLVTASGVTFDHTIDVALETPTANARFLGLFALIGIYVGVLPVALGILWLPLVRRLGRSGLEFVLALTIGLLLFLFVDTVEDGLETAHELASSYQGIVAFVLVSGLAFLAIESLGAWLRQRTTSRQGESGAWGKPAWTSALLMAIAIGLHNLGEGLAIGAAFRLGEVALGTLLIVGFALHNTTEGLAIVSPLSKEKTHWPRLLWLGLLAGAPTILGAWIGGLVYSTFWSMIFLAIGAGAIAQVVPQIGRGMAGGRELLPFLTSRPIFAGLATGFAVMYLTGMIVGG